ncbi:acyl-CoA dehydrogenase family protein [Desulfoscipio gibsoniae]|uniref:Acyl-CoA dehydrogenase n=1 Tax=Desulfoscipio gibsoniae DSM 7213 TaxID=767817 RepID=R4KKV8_9FIRM|nr:acyl-CoA dehydrogenase family protein [Desulfoscipio gibsoniae]AGL03294.1 acyl-CoA dehydrogenase [Desulfoscipio gibsoniae DSM 7213]
MDFTFTKEQELLREIIRKFTDKEVKPRAAEADRNHRLDPELIKMGADLGLFGILYPPELGGSGMGFTGLCIMLEELSRGCASFPLMLATHQGIGVMGIYLTGTPEQKEKYMTPCVEGQKIAACAITEPDAGSDIASMKTRAVLNGDHYIINGTKRFITNGGIADVIVVFAIVDSTPDNPGGMTAFIVEKDFPGFNVGKIEEKMGIRASSTAELFFEDMVVPVENVLGQVGKGFKLARQILEAGGRVTLGAMCLGAAKELVDLSIAYAKERKQFGRPIQDFQGIQWMLTDMAVSAYTMESIVYRTAWALDQGLPTTMDAAICKLYCSEGIDLVVDKAMQIFAGSGYMTDYPIERFYRDARINRIYEGTSEIQRMIIASTLVKKGVF